MAITYGLWIQCDQCGVGSGDAGVPIEVPFEVMGTTEQDRVTAERKATRHAIDSGFVQTSDGRLLCPDCTNPDEDTDERADDGD